MSIIRLKPHFSVKKAHDAQLRLSKQIIMEDRLPEKIRYVAGVDVAYLRDISIGAVAVLDYTTLRLVEAQTARCKIRFPYVPTLLSFRETPPAVLCIKKLHTRPDILLADGHGFAHPYQCGFASYLGLVIGRPTIGVAKNRLIGKAENTKDEDIIYLKYGGKVIGAAVTTKHGCKPVYVSVGHMVSLKTAIKIVKNCTLHTRLPEPLLKAHQVATAEKRKFQT